MICAHNIAVGRGVMRDIHRFPNDLRDSVKSILLLPPTGLNAMSTRKQ